METQSLQYPQLCQSNETYNKVKSKQVTETTQVTYMHTYTCIKYKFHMEKSKNYLNNGIIYKLGN